MAVVTNPSIDAKTRGIILHIVEQIKSEGVFDRFRRECLEELDSKEPYRQLKQRVESHVATFLSKQAYSKSLPKNQLRNSLRANISQSGVLSKGVDRLLEQVLTDKSSCFYNEIENLVHDHLSSIGHYPRREKPPPKPEVSKLTDKEIDDFIKEETSKLLEAEGEKLKEGSSSKSEPTTSTENNVGEIAQNDGGFATGESEVVSAIDVSGASSSAQLASNDKNDGNLCSDDTITMDEAKPVSPKEGEPISPSDVESVLPTAKPISPTNIKTDQLATDVEMPSSEDDQALTSEVKSTVVSDVAKPVSPPSTEPVPPGSEDIKLCSTEDMIVEPTPITDTDQDSSKPDIPDLPNDSEPVLPIIEAEENAAAEPRTKPVLPENTSTEAVTLENTNRQQITLKDTKPVLPESNITQQASEPVLLPIETKPKQVGDAKQGVPKAKSKLVLLKDDEPASPKEANTKPVSAEVDKPVSLKEAKAKPILSTKDAKPASPNEANTKTVFAEAAKPVSQLKEAKTKPVLLKDMKPASPKGVKTKPVLSKNTKPASPKEPSTKSVSLKDAKTKTVLSKDMKPASPKVAKAVLSKDAKPASPKEAVTKQVSAEVAKPVSLKDAKTKPALSKDVKPASPKIAKAILSKDAKPSLKETKSKPVSGEITKSASLKEVKSKPVLAKDANTASPREAKTKAIKAKETKAKQVLTEVSKSVTPKETKSKPISLKETDVKPVLPKDAKPVPPKESQTKPVLQELGKLVLPKGGKPTSLKQSNAGLPKVSKSVSKPKSAKGTKPKFSKKSEGTRLTGHVSTDNDTDNEDMTGLSSSKLSLLDKEYESKALDADLSDSDITVSSVHTSDLSSLEDSDMEYEEYKAMAQKAKLMETEHDSGETGGTKTVEVERSDEEDEGPSSCWTDSDVATPRDVVKRRKVISSEAGSDCSSEVSEASHGGAKRRSARVTSEDRVEEKQDESVISEIEERRETEGDCSPSKSNELIAESPRLSPVEDETVVRDKQDRKRTSKDSTDSDSDVVRSKRSRRTIRPTRCYSPSDNS